LHCWFCAPPSSSRMRSRGSSPLLVLCGLVACAQLGAAIGIFGKRSGAHHAQPKSFSKVRSEPLHLSDLLENGKSTEEIRSAAEVHMGGRITFSGFFKTARTVDRNMFFWFFPAMNNDSDAPLVIWLQGGPGGSSLFGNFHEIGPWALARGPNGDVVLQPRKVTWNERYSLLFIDNPVGAGFSYTTSQDGYCRTEEEVAESLFSVLAQFYAVFPKQKHVDLYLTGESYAGHYLPAFAFHIVSVNSKLAPESRVPLKGVAIGDGWIDPINMLPAYAPMLLSMGLAGAKEAAVLKDYTDRIGAAIEATQMELAFRIWDEMINGDLFPYGSYFYNLTGSTDYDNCLNTNAPPELELYGEFLNQAWVREALHVGNVPFGLNASDCEKHLVADFMRSMLPELQAIIPHTKVLVYSGNLDIIVGAPLTENFISRLAFAGSELFHAAPRKQFRTLGSPEQVSGYVRHSEQFTHAVIRNAGHLLPHDQPARAMDLITRFIETEQGWCECQPCESQAICCPAPPNAPQLC